MGNKQVESVITDYFNALLDEGGVQDAVTVEQSKVKQGNAPTTEDMNIEETVAKKTDTTMPMAENNKALAEAPLVSGKQVSDKKIPSEEESVSSRLLASSTQTFSTEAVPAKEIPVTKSISAEQTSSISATDSSHANDLNRGAYITQSKPDISSKPGIETSAYEQHKQRLEKMLQQVSALEMQTETKTAPIESPTIQEQQLDVAAEEAVVDAAAAYQALPALSSEWLENGRPNWAQDRFDILLIEVNGLQLAAPLVALGQIQTMDEQLTPLFGQSDWFMGLQKSPIGNIKTVNTAKFVMPERYQDDHDYKYVVSINGLNWGLAVDCIHQPISIDPDAIRWRPNRSSRPWMAGMVKDHMCVLLDIPTMGELLQKQDKNHQESTGG